jgi:hypothetical protein
MRAMRVVAALAMYGAVSLLFFGLPVLDHPTTTIVADEQIESGAFQWFLAWWPDAILDGRNPLVSHFVYAPDGVNMTWVTGVPGPALLLTPITRGIGPVASYNLLSLVAPVLAGGAAFLLCREVTRSFWPSVAGGYLFAFSPFMLATLAGVPNLSFMALVPLAAYLVIRRVRGSLGRRAFVPLLAAVLAGQVLVTVEVFAMVTVFGGLLGLAAFLLLPDHRPALKRAVPEVAVAYLVVVLVLSPYFWYMLFEPHMRPTHAIPEQHSIDLLGFVVPTSLQGVGGDLFPGVERKLGGAIPVAGGSGGLAYLGLPLVAIVALFGLGHWRRPAARLLLIAAVGLAVLSLGPWLHVGGEKLVPLPEAALAELPLLRYALPNRMPVYTFLAVALIVAVWLASRPARWKWALASIGLVLLLPNLGAGFWKTSIGTLPFFEDKLYEGVVNEDDIVFTLPVLGPSMRWQAEARMPFRLANGYVGRIPGDLQRFYSLVGAPGPLPERETRRFLAHTRVSVILIAEPETEQARWRRRLAFLGVEPQVRGGVLLYRLAPPGGRPVARF